MPRLLNYTFISIYRTTKFLIKKIRLQFDYGIIESGDVKKNKSHFSLITLPLQSAYQKESRKHEKVVLTP